jgi:hypothetical protein
MGYLEQDNGRANIERCLQALVAAAVRQKMCLKRSFLA